MVANCDHPQKLKFSKTLPYAFTEHGAIQAANVLASAQAVEMGIYVVRAFVQLRQAATLHADLAKRLTELESKTEALSMLHETLSNNTRFEFRQVFDALRELASKVTTKKTRKQEFLEQMEQVVPWAALVKRIEPYYPEGKNGSRFKPKLTCMNQNF